MVNPKIVEAYKIAKQKLFEQGEQSVNIYGTCVYLDSKTGRRCIIGWMLDDEIIDLDALSGSVNNLVVQGSLNKSLGLKNMSMADIDFLRSAQGIHDNFDTRMWREKFAALEERFGIKLEGEQTC